MVTTSFLIVCKSMKIVQTPSHWPTRNLNKTLPCDWPKVTRMNKMFSVQLHQCVEMFQHSNGLNITHVI
jgi:hypothetical protein